MYTDIFMYKRPNEGKVKRMKEREDFKCIHRKMQKCKAEDNMKEYYRLRRIEHNTLLASVEKKEKYRRTYFDKPKESVVN